MSDTDIRVCELSKRYHLVEPRSYKTLRDTIVHAFSRSFRRRPPKEENWIWALRDVNIEIKRGELVGIVGRNGAGKSTLLKVLARIVEPTTGYAEIKGRSSSLLEVGTGFHQELSGRENIYLNGSILGMKRDEIKERFDEIVEFSGVGRFLDTPVKHYSSGMRVRLAFSVSAHLRADILFIDEVLSVGDYQFQQKSLAKMKEVARDGRTILFVSHNLSSIKDMCQRCLVFDDGELKYKGSVDEALALYFMNFAEDRRETLTGSWRNVRIDGNNGSGLTIRGDQPFRIQADLNLGEEFIDGQLFLKLKDTTGNALVRERISADTLVGNQLNSGPYQISVDLPALWLAPGIYILLFWFTGRTKLGKEKRYTSPHIMMNVSGSLKKNDPLQIFLHPPLQWKMDCDHGAGTIHKSRLGS